MKRPAEVYRSCDRPCPATLPELSYPTHDDTVRVSRYGQIRISRHKQVRLSAALADEHVGVRELDDGRWLVTFANIELGYVGPGRSFTPLNSNPPEAQKLLPMCPV